MITILDNGVHIENGQMQYLWFCVQDQASAQRYFRAVALMELASVPVTIREDYDLLQKQWAAVRGLYNARADFIYSSAGIFTPEHIGIVQFYGGAGEGASQDEAAQLALRNLAAVRATLANYEQSRLAAPNPLWVEWYLDFVTRRSQNVLALLGHPDPRQTRRGLGREGEIANDTGDNLAAEQNEILFRGLARLREDFIFQVTAERIGRKHLAEALVRVAQVTSNIASRQRGSLNIGFNLSIPLVAALSSGITGSRSGTDSHSQNTSDGVSDGWGQNHTDSYAHTRSQSSTVGEAETHGIAIGHSDAESWAYSKAHANNFSTTESQSTSVGHATTHGSSSNWSQGQSSNWSQGQSDNWSQGQSDNWSAGASTNWSEGQSSSASQSASTSATETASQSQSDTLSASVTGGVNVGVASGSATVGGSQSTQTGTSTGVTQGASTGASQEQSSSAGGGLSASFGGGSSASVGGGSSSSVGGGSFSSKGGGSFSSTSDSVTKTNGTATTRGTSEMTGFTYGISSADSVIESHSWTKSKAFSQGTADTWGVADGRSQNWERSHSQGETTGQALGRAASTGFNGGFSSGLVPGISLGRSWQAEDDLAMRLTEILRAFEAQLNTASAEGGFMTDALLLTASSAGEAAARALVPQAFHGPGVPTPVLTLQPVGQDAQDMRDHALAFLHYPGQEASDPLGGYLFTKYATLLTAGQLAAYTAPGLFEEGTAMTVMAPIPKGMGFYPAMPGDVLLGHQYSPETSDLTTAAVRLDADCLMHTLFAGDTGWGKSVAAISMAYESTLKWHIRTVVLDFGAGWRQLLNAPGLQGHVDILQLWPDAVRPFRWNPLQIGRNINPETQWRAFADIFGSIAKLGVRRQKQELLQALRNIYLQHGVLIDDPAVRGDPEWGSVRDAEESALIGLAVKTPLGELSREQRQALAVLRSSVVGLSDLYREVQARLAQVPPRDTMLAGVLEGILFRLNPLVQGSAAEQFAPGPNATPLEDLARPWGIAVIEGGIFLDDFGKAFLLGWAGWHLYTDMIARRVHEVNDGEPLLQIFFEEANKIFGGIGEDQGDEEGGGVSTSQRFGDMFRDARKYRCRLHVITQAPSLLPQDIISSCNNLVIGFLKNPRDKDIVLSALARSEKGFHDEPWRRFLTNENIGMLIGRFPYSDSREYQQPLLFRPLMLDVPEPTDAEIERVLGRITL